MQLTMRLKSARATHREERVGERKDGQYHGHLLHDLFFVGGLTWLEAQGVRALRVTRGSQGLLMPAELSLWDNSLPFVTNSRLAFTFPSSSYDATQGAVTPVTPQATTVRL